ncbi:MAG: histidinol-phosphatase HisJ family protein [Syntrophomonadaceae bacterium]|nr:histidinol-phosphatase HisJ family protein [Syntrophomonadaceae bacterium]
MLVDYHIHALAHGEFEYTREWIERFLAQAVERRVQQVGFAEHEEFAPRIVLPALRQAHSGDYQGLRVRIGLEIDYKPGRELEIQEIIEGRAYDFIIGSIHYIDEWAFDHPDYRDGFDDQDIDKLYEKYYILVAQAVNTGLFDIIGHLDLIKIWGHRALHKAEEDFILPLLKELRRSGVVVEVNTSGLRKPVGEIYPSEKLLEVLFNANIPITFGSDAHHPDDVGRDMMYALQAARRAGYRVFMSFNRRRAILSPLSL